MADASAVILGIGIGALATAGVAWATARRHLARTREAEQRARVAERMAEIGAMTGGLAHEIKNPLSTIGLNAQLLAETIDELPIAEDDRGRLSRRISALRREVDRLRGILSDFLQYAGQLHLEPRPTDLNTIVEELVDFFLPQAEKQGVRLRTDLGQGPLTPRELILRTHRIAERKAEPRIALHVIDTGPGMTPETLCKIFEPYFTTKAGGSGLGLPTSRRIIEGHHGTLDVHTEPGRGTDFVLTFPAA
jgi:signal transduction histidine kinase